MRTIKFRAWDKITKQIFEVKQIDFNAIERNVYGFITSKSILGGVDESLSFRSFNGVELMQFTGIKDKHGTEIYEGDIIKFINKEGVEIISEVVFYDGVFELTNYDYRNCKDNSCVNCYELLKWVACDCEIIGNIYENKERLDDK